MANIDIRCSHCLNIYKSLFDIHRSFDIEVYKKTCNNCLELHRIGEGRDPRYWEHGWIK